MNEYQIKSNIFVDVFEKQIKYASKLNLVVLKYNALEKSPVYDFLFKETRFYL